MDLHHRRADADPGDDILIAQLEITREMGNVGRRAAHVKTDQQAGAKRRAPRDHADDTSGGA